MLDLAETLEYAAVGFVASLVGTYVIAMWKGAEALDSGQRGMLVAADAKYVALDSEHKALTSVFQQPARTPAEKERLRLVAGVIEHRGELGAAVLRHLRHHETITLTSHRQTGQTDCSAMLPGIAPSDFYRVLHELVCDQLVKRDDKANTTQTVTCEFRIAPGLVAAVDEVAYAKSS